MAKLAAPLCGRVCRGSEVTSTSLSAGSYPSGINRYVCNIEGFHRNEVIFNTNEFDIENVSFLTTPNR